MSSLTLVVCKQKRRTTTHSTRIHLLVLLGRYQRAYQSLATDRCCGPIRTVDQQHLFRRVAQKTHETKSCAVNDGAAPLRGGAVTWQPPDLFSTCCNQSSWTLPPPCSATCRIAGAADGRAAQQRTWSAVQAASNDTMLPCAAGESNRA
jgi:hypothetical protein